MIRWFLFISICMVSLTVNANSPEEAGDASEAGSTHVNEVCNNECHRNATSLSRQVHPHKDLERVTAIAGSPAKAPPAPGRSKAVRED